MKIQTYNPICQTESITKRVFGIVCERIRIEKLDAIIETGLNQLFLTTINEYDYFDLTTYIDGAIDVLEDT
jgi:hypothetical protein